MKKQSLMVGLLPMYLLLGSTAANAQSVEEQLGYCAQIKNPLERLVCFDNLAAGKAVAYQGPAPTQAGTAAASSAVAEFGREHVADTTDADNAPSRIAITVVGIPKICVGYYKLRLAMAKCGSKQAVKVSHLTRKRTILSSAVH